MQIQKNKDLYTVFTHSHTHTHLYIYIHIKCIYIYVHAYEYIYIYAYIYIYTFININIYIYIFIAALKFNFPALVTCVCAPMPATSNLYVRVVQSVPPQQLNVRSHIKRSLMWERTLGCWGGTLWTTPCVICTSVICRITSPDILQTCVLHYASTGLAYMSLVLFHSSV